MMRSAEIYAEHEDLDPVYIHRWIANGFLRPIERRWGTYAGEPGKGSHGHVLPDWTRRMVRLLRTVDLPRRNSESLTHRLLRDAADLMDQAEAGAQPGADWYVSVDGGPATAVDTASGVADLLRGATCATILAVPA